VINNPTREKTFYNSGNQAKMI